MSVYKVSSVEQSTTKSWAIKFSTIGRVSLDDIVDDLIIDSEETNLDDIESSRKVYDDMKDIVDRYLNNAERFVYHLYVDAGKNVAQIQKICNFGCWFTAQAHLIRVFKLTKLYYEYEKMDKIYLDNIINDNFNQIEAEIIKCLHSRMSYPEISKHIKLYYRKAYYMCQDVLKKMEQVVPEYYSFIVHLRKFKRLNVDIKGVEF